jgi:hypothetical protein
MVADHFPIQIFQYFFQNYHYGILWRSTNQYFFPLNPPTFFGEIMRSSPSPSIPRYPQIPLTQRQELRRAVEQRARPQRASGAAPGALGQVFAETVQSRLEDWGFCEFWILVVNPNHQNMIVLSSPNHR